MNCLKQKSNLSLNLRLTEKDREKERETLTERVIIEGWENNHPFVKL
jgi:hypothetical protein